MFLTRKVKPILNMPAPTNTQELRSYLGAINYYGKCLPSIHNLREPLNKLLNKNVKFHWRNENI